MGAAGAWLPKFKDRQVRRVPGFSAFTFYKELLLSSRLAAFDGSLLLLSVTPTSTQDDLSPFHRVGGGSHLT